MVSNNKKYFTYDYFVYCLITISIFPRVCAIFVCLPRGFLSCKLKHLGLVGKWRRYDLDDMISKQLFHIILYLYLLVLLALLLQSNLAPYSDNSDNCKHYGYNTEREGYSTLSYRTFWTSQFLIKFCSLPIKDLTSLNCRIILFPIWCPKSSSSRFIRQNLYYLCNST